MSPRELQNALKSDAASEQQRTWRCPDESGLAAYVDGRMGTRDREKWSKHLAGCGCCLGQVAALANLAEEAPVAVSEDLVARAARLVPRGAPARRSQGWRWALAATATAGL